MSAQQTYKAITYNIRWSNPDDGDDIWDNRREGIGNFFLEEKADFIGLQEALEGQLQYLDRYLDKYDYIGVGRDDGEAEGEFCPLFYDSTKWEKIEYSTIWLSDTPDQVSRGWDAACNRLVTFGLFRNKISEDTLAVYNTHLDHKGDIARKESIGTIKAFVERTGKGHEQIILGDFNMTTTTSMYREMVKNFNDARIAANHHYEEHSGTFNGFRLNGKYKRRIDYIFTSKTLPVLQYDCPDLRIDGRHLSDHFPIIAIVKIKDAH
jgi:endonuclease/exonuclease/phosphatase family metal-dependent hydrolase